MTDRRDTGTVDTHAVVDLANGFAVVGYSLFAYQQPGPLAVLRPIQHVDVTTPIADQVAAAVAERYDEGMHATVAVETVAVVETAAPAPAPAVVVEETTIVSDVPAEAGTQETHFQPEGDLGYTPAAPVYEESEPEPVAARVEQVVVDESKRISAPTLSWDPEVWKPAAEKEAALKRLGEHGEVHAAIDDPAHAEGIAYDDPAEEQPAPTPEPVAAAPAAAPGPPVARSTVSMLQELSFLDE